MHFVSNLLVVSCFAASALSAPTLPSGAFNLEGYAKENPNGETTGGKGGATTTVTAIAGLATAVKVRTLPVLIAIRQVDDEADISYDRAPTR